jgi:hypothetical protein
MDPGGDSQAAHCPPHASLGVECEGPEADGQPREAQRVGRDRLADGRVARGSRSSQAFAIGSWGGPARPAAPGRCQAGRPSPVRATRARAARVPPVRRAPRRARSAHHPSDRTGPPDARARPRGHGRSPPPRRPDGRSSEPRPREGRLSRRGRGGRRRARRSRRPPWRRPSAHSARSARRCRGRGERNRLPAGASAA